MMTSSNDKRTSRRNRRAGARRGRPRVFHVTNIPTPYRLPYYRAVSAALDAAGIDMHVFFIGKGKRRREWKIGKEELHGFASTASAGADPLRAMAAAIEADRPDVVVIAWAMDPLALRLLLYCRRHRIPTILFTGETIATAAGRSYSWVRAIARLPFFRLANGFLTYGTRSAEYLRRYKVPERAITVGINVVDTEYFRRSVDELRRSGEAERMRKEYAMRDGGSFTAHLLLVSYMIPGKGISSTLRALARIGRDDIAIHLVGSGPREEAHRALARELGLEDRVFFHGYRQTPEMPRYYAFADVALFPSSIDVFGLVMVEASAAALPVIASINSGGTVDVVEDGVTGIVIDPRDAGAYAAAILRLADHPRVRERMGRAARERAVRDLTPERSAERYLAAIMKIVHPRS